MKYTDMIKLDFNDKNINRKQCADGKGTLLYFADGISMEMSPKSILKN